MSHDIMSQDMMQQDMMQHYMCPMIWCHMTCITWYMMSHYMCHMMMSHSMSHDMMSHDMSYDTTYPITWHLTWHEAGLEIASCQWPKAGHMLEMAGKNKFELPSKIMAGEILWIYFISFAYHNSYILDHLVD
jgi:hypothetical protein